MASNEKLTVNFLKNPLYDKLLFSCCCQYSMSLAFNILIIMCLSGISSYHTWSLLNHLDMKIGIFYQIWEVSKPFIFPGILSALSSHSSPSGTPIMCILACWLVSHRSLKLYIALYYCSIFTCSICSLFLYFLLYFELIVYFLKFHFIVFFIFSGCSNVYNKLF